MNTIMLIKRRIPCHRKNPSVGYEQEKDVAHGDDQWR